MERLGVNAASLTGFSVAGAHFVRGAAGNNKVLTTAPGKLLDFGSGLLDLGNTVGDLFGILSGNNAPGNVLLFDPMTSGGASILPLEITAFNVSLTANKQVLIQWSVSSELETGTYQVERSANGSVWETIDVIPARTQNALVEDYSVTDVNPYAGVNYYRLKQVNLDNAYFYSIIKTINNNSGSASQLKIANPFSAGIILQLSSVRKGSVVMDLMDINGRIVHHQAGTLQAGANSLWIDGLSGLAKGMYLLRINTGATTTTTKLVKE